MPAELDLAAFDTGVKCIELLIFIIRTVQGVKKLKAECDEVKSIASILLEVLEANKDVLKGQKTTAKLEKVLQEVSKFVVECKESNVRLGNLVEASLAGAIERSDDMDRATRH